MNELQKEYEAWLKDNLPSVMLDSKEWDLSAESLMAMIGHEDELWSPSNEQYDWLRDFCKQWDVRANR
tara:strand:+ start:188 stop:391 length:204 start_codon:yes stop_codon:yes gene_type:complete